MRDYVLKKLREADVGNDLMSLCWRDKIRDHINQITEDVNSSGIWTALETIIQQEKREKNNAKEVLSPSLNHNEAQGNKVYFASDEYKKREAKNLKIWEKTVSVNKIGPKDFSMFGNFTRHVLGRCSYYKNKILTILV